MFVPLVKLPSLDLVRGFVAVGRRMSITLAAADLCLTQSAVSRQVHALEQALGVKLLVRGHRSIAFTAEGERLFRSADSAMQQLQDVVGAVRAAESRRPVTVSTTTGVAGLWLLPRLGRLQQRHPGIDLRVAANNQLADLRSEGIDLAIRYGPQSAMPPGAMRLFGETIVPVAHPSLGLKSITSAKAISQLCLLEFDDVRRPWLQWGELLAAMGWLQARPKSVLHFNQYDQMIQAAVAGQGVALGRLELIRPMLADGRLMQLATARQRNDSPYAFWLIEADPQAGDDVRKVSDWLREEAAEVVTG
ncbi:MAG TPA: LysR substrate-binding domain-containing protein [Rhodocyclaceae bacterium]